MYSKRTRHGFAAKGKWADVSYFVIKTCYLRTSYINISRAIIYKISHALAIHLTQSYNKLYYDETTMRLGKIYIF